MISTLVAVGGGANATELPSRVNAWSQIAGPIPGPGEAIGKDTAGCLAGGRALPPQGPGYAVVRPSRRRYFGHQELVGFIERLGQRAQDASLPVFYVGDMAQPRGGPLPFGHASHQTGLDVDIWFTTDTRPNPSLAERETPVLPSMLLPDRSGVDPTLFGKRQVELLKLAASDPRVDRIFVSPMIKLALCRGFGGALSSGADWLHRLRPWWGHDDHFHVRLACPEGSPLCVPQKPVPDGEGCDAALEDWTRHLTLPPHGERPPPVLPAACQAILQAPAQVPVSASDGPG